MRPLVAADDGGKVTAHAGGLQIVQHAGAVCGGSNGHFAVPGAQRVQQLEQPRPQRHAVLQPCFHLAPYLCGHVVVGEPGAEAFQKCTAAAFVVAPPQQRDILRRHRHAVFARHGAPHLVSQTLGVEHQAVHVEQDGADLLFHCFPNLSSFLCGRPLPDRFSLYTKRCEKQTARRGTVERKYALARKKWRIYTFSAVCPL